MPLEVEIQIEQLGAGGTWWGRATTRDVGREAHTTAHECRTGNFDAVHDEIGEFIRGDRTAQSDDRARMRDANSMKLLWKFIQLLVQLPVQLAVQETACTPLRLRLVSQIVTFIRHSRRVYTAQP